MAMRDEDFDKQRCWEEVESHLIGLMRLLSEWCTDEEGKATTLEPKLKQANWDITKIYAELWVEVHSDEIYETINHVIKK